MLGKIFISWVIFLVYIGYILYVFLVLSDNKNYVINFYNSEILLYLFYKDNNWGMRKIK